MTHQQINPLVHFIFIYYMAVTPKYISLRLPPEDIERLSSLRGRELIHLACELTDFLSMEDKIRHVDWVKSSL